MQDKDKIIIDLDDTITIDSSDKEYSKKAPNKKIRDTINKLHKKSFPITIFSARNMRSLEGNLEKINQNYQVILWSTNTNAVNVNSKKLFILDLHIEKTKIHQYMFQPIRVLLN